MAAPFGSEELEESQRPSEYDDIDVGDGPWRRGRGHLDDPDRPFWNDDPSYLGDPSKDPGPIDTPLADP